MIMTDEFLKGVIEKKREAKPGEKMQISKCVYQEKIGLAYRKGQVNALMSAGYSLPEIAVFLDIREASVERIMKMTIR